MATNYSGVYSGLTTVGMTLIAGAAQVADIKARSKATLAAIEAEANSMMIQKEILQDQADDLDRELGDSMSQNALAAMKAEARLRAGAAETGTAGGTTTTATKEAYMVQTLDNAILIGRKRGAETDIARRSLMIAVGFDNRMQELQGSMPTPMGAFMATLNSSMSGYQSGSKLAGTYSQQPSGYNGAGLNVNTFDMDNNLGQQSVNNQYF